jgi:hypothetical protein
VDIVGYVNCANPHCQALTPETTAWQTRGVCFDCFKANVMPHMRDVEVSQRAAVTTIQRRRNRGKNKKTPTQVKNELARARAARRLAYLFPDVYDILVADERSKVGLEPQVRVDKDHLATAVETYLAFAAYHAGRTGDGDAANEAT